MDSSIFPTFSSGSFLLNFGQCAVEPFFVFLIQPATNW